MKSGKRSCCARGGAWFKNCGDASDTKFDHTWIEGVRVCEGHVSLHSVEPPIKALSYQGRGRAYPLNDINAANTPQQQTNVNHTIDISNVITVDCKDGVGLTKCVVFICVLSIVS